jgi:chromosome segregation ATPase
LTKVVEKIIAENNGESLRKCVAELEEENSQLTTVAAESSETIAKL